MRGHDGNGGFDNVEHLASFRAVRPASDRGSDRDADRGDEMIHAEIRALYDYWERLRAGRPCPYRAEVDPRDMAGDARHLFVLEDLGQGNIRFRLAGTAHMDAFGYDLRGMSARSIMEGRARESFVALISETLAEPGVGYARLTLPDGESVWEILLLPLRDNFGNVQRLLGCLHPISGRVPQHDGETAMRFTIEEMSIQPVGVTQGEAGDTQALPGFAEGQSAFESGPSGLTAIDGGLNGDRPDGKRPRLRVIKSDDT